MIIVIFTLLHTTTKMDNNYKDSEPQIWPKIKDNSKTTRGLFSAKEFLDMRKWQKY